eukprot:1162005-Pelagomonas_calceolata.AAC.9
MTNCTWALDCVLEPIMGTASSKGLGPAGSSFTDQSSSSDSKTHEARQCLPCCVAQTYEACQSLLAEGLDLSGAAGSSSAAERLLAEEE